MEVVEDLPGQAPQRQGLLAAARARGRMPQPEQQAALWAERNGLRHADPS
jgi:hypothetical protein